MKPLISKGRSSQEAKWSFLVRFRDDYNCHLEYYDKGSITHFSGWRDCGNHATDAAHILRRSEAGKMKFSDPVLGVAACRQHHELLHRMDSKIRVPPARVMAAKRYLVEQYKLGNLKVLPKNCVCLLNENEPPTELLLSP